MDLIRKILYENDVKEQVHTRYLRVMDGSVMLAESDVTFRKKIHGYRLYI